MAKFKQGNILIKQDKKVIFGNNDEVSLYYDGSRLKVSGQQIGRYSFISALARDFDLDDVDSGIIHGKVFGILRTLDYNADTKGSAYASFALPDGFQSNKDIQIRVIYSLNGNDDSQIVKLTTSIWTSAFASTPSTPDYTYTNTIASDINNNIGKLSKLVLANTIIPSSVFSSDKYITVKHTRDADDAADTYSGTYQFISMQFFQ